MHVLEALVVDAPAAPCVTAPLPPSTLDEGLGALFMLGKSLLQARRCSLYLRVREDDCLRLSQASGLAAGVACSVPAEGTVMGLVMRSRVPLLAQNIAAYPSLPLRPERYATSSFLSVPVLVENDTIGVLNAADRQDSHPFSEDDLSNAELVARAMATLLYSDLLARRAIDDGEIDPATGLYNARHLEKRLHQEVERAQRAGLPLTLLLLGVNSYADLAAHVGLQPAGVLMRCVGEMVAQTIRQSDVLALRADDEIAILLPVTPPDKARRVARTIAREVVHHKLVAHLRYDLESLQTSIGLAALGPSMNGAGLIEQAAAALAQARLQGDAIVIAAGEALSEVSRRVQPRVAQQQAIATALRLGIPYLANPSEAATSSAVRLLSSEMARTYLCFPVAFEAGTLTLAMADPVDAGAIQAVSQYTNLAVYPVASPREKILQAIATMMKGRVPH